jgi:hypothetical protein
VALSLGLIFGATSGLIERLVSGESEMRSGSISGLITLVGVGLGCWSQSPLRNSFMSGSIGGLIGGLYAGLYERQNEPLEEVLFAGLLVGLTVGSISGLGVGSLDHIALVETMSWRWNRFWKRTIPGLVVGLSIGPINGFIFGLHLGLFGGLFVGLIFGLTFALVSGLVGGLTDTVKVDKASPNQGIKLSRKNSLAVFLATLLTCGLIGGLIGGLTGEGPIVGLIYGLTIGLIVGLIVGLNRGGSAVIKHYALRLILWLKGYTPFHFIKFLDYCAKLILLKKVGGGHIFIHRMLLEYFAELTPESIRTTGSK